MHFLNIFTLIATILCAFKANAAVYVDGNIFTSLSEAKASIKDGSRIYLDKGIYREGLYLKQNNLSIVGEQGVVFDNASTDGKAAFVLLGNDILVESIECVNISVPDGNGACIRFAGQNLTARGLYVHDSESGIMTSRVAGYVNIEFSRFERLGSRNGYAHAVYIKADTLNISDSYFLSTKKQGSSIKSRSKKVIITNSVLASMEGIDSRLIDMANYGDLTIQNSILQQGPNSSNSQLIAYGLEKKVKKLYAVNQIKLMDNLVLFDRKKANVLLSQRLADKIEVKNNIFVGESLDKDHFIEHNTWIQSRSDALINDYPYIPQLNDLARLINIIKIIGIKQ